ncbi:MAG TPA: hypothetical protein ENN34_04075 [Deltaproteobacteria bacterium]|nr:hypothetical protein [Deltaproteobacteria bacterium]
MTRKLTYAGWKTVNRTVLETLPGKTVLMAFSGGKDGSIVLHFLDIAGKEFGFEFEIVGATFPNHVFPRNEVERLSEYWHSRGVVIRWASPELPDSVLDEAERSGGSACRICQKTKREMLGNYLKEGKAGKEVVIILSFNLWDIVTYSVEHLLGGVYKQTDTSLPSSDLINEDRFTVTSHRFYPFITLKDGLSIFKPLIRYNENEIIEAVTEANIVFSDIPCKFKDTRTKRVLFDYYRQMNLTFDYDKVRNFYETTLKSRDLSYYTELKKEDLISVL